MMKVALISVSLLALCAGLGGPAAAQQGPVASACANEMAQVCAGKKHGQGEMRACLEANKDKVSPACKQALDTHQPGQRRQ